MIHTKDVIILTLSILLAFCILEIVKLSTQVKTGVTLISGKAYICRAIPDAVISQQGGDEK
jgi:hypothetical protein